MLEFICTDLSNIFYFVYSMKRVPFFFSLMLWTVALLAYVWWPNTMENRLIWILCAREANIPEEECQCSALAMLQRV